MFALLFVTQHAPQKATLKKKEEAYSVESTNNLGEI